MLNSKSNLKSKIVYSVAEINKVDWNLLPTNNIFLELKYLESIEQTVNEVYQFIYVIYYDKNDDPVGKSIFQLLQYDTATFNFNSIPCRFQNKVLRHFLNKNISILIAGNIFATGENAFSFLDGIKDKEIFKSINKVIDILIKENKEINYAAFKEFYPNSSNVEYLKNKHQYLKFNIDVNMVLNLNDKWKDFADVTIDFKTKYRSRTKNVIKKSASLQVKEFSLEDIITHSDRIEDLYQQVLRKSNFNIGIFTIETFIKLKENLKEKYSVFGYFIDDRLIGFRSAFIANNILETSFVGIDYDLNLKYDLYQKMLIDYIDNGLKFKSKTIGFGRTAETMKSCVGAEPINMNLFIRPKRKTGMFLLKLIVGNIKPTKFSIRNPFKQDYYKMPKNAVISSKQAAKNLKLQES